MYSINNINNLYDENNQYQVDEIDKSNTNELIV